MNRRERILGYIVIVFGIAGFLYVLYIYGAILGR
jgi:hypothetical protein